MRFKLTNCVALGTHDMTKAAEFYENVLGFERGTESDDWVELKSGALQIYVCHDDVVQPVFELETSDVPQAIEHLSQNGCERVVFDEDDSEVFMKDPFGYIYCISTEK